MAFFSLPTIYHILWSLEPQSQALPLPQPQIWDAASLKNILHLLIWGCTLQLLKAFNAVYFFCAVHQSVVHLESTNVSVLCQGNTDYFFFTDGKTEVQKTHKTYPSSHTSMWHEWRHKAYPLDTEAESVSTSLNQPGNLSQAQGPCHHTRHWSVVCPGPTLPQVSSTSECFLDELLLPPLKSGWQKPRNTTPFICSWWLLQTWAKANWKWWISPGQRQLRVGTVRHKIKNSAREIWGAIAFLPLKVNEEARSAHYCLQSGGTRLRVKPTRETITKKVRQSLH